MNWGDFMKKVYFDKSLEKYYSLFEKVNYNYTFFDVNNEINYNITSFYVIDFTNNFEKKKELIRSINPILLQNFILILNSPEDVTDDVLELHIPNILFFMTKFELILKNISLIIVNPIYKEIINNLENSILGLIVLKNKFDTSVLLTNDNINNLLSYNQDDRYKIKKYSDFSKYIYFEDLPLFKNTLQSLNNNSVEGEFRINKKDGNYIWCNIIFSENSINNSVNLRLKECTKAKKDLKKLEIATKELKFRAEHDILTGLFNRETFNQKVSELLKIELVDSILLKLDIEKFKLVNDLHGEPLGDKIIKEMANFLSNYFNSNAIISRFNSANFMIYTNSEQFEIEDFIIDFDNNLQNVFLHIKINTFFGIYKIVNRQLSVVEMGDNASLALQQAKNIKSIRYVFYNDSFRLKIIREQLIISEFDEAIKNKNFTFYLQPILSSYTNEIIYAEALVRWVHPSKGVIPPSEFIPIYEKNGFIIKLDEFIREEACILLRKWIDQKNKIIPISLNLSKAEINDSNLLDSIIKLTKKYNIPHDYLKFEITESLFDENNPKLVALIDAMHKENFKILMDDFGSEYSSLNMLKRLDVDILKIDLKFLGSTNEFELEKSNTILSSIVKMAKWLKMPVVVEGVESKSQVNFLSTIGCDFLQGYFFSEPILINEFENLLEYNLINNDFFNIEDLNIVFSDDYIIRELYENNNTSLALFSLQNDCLELLKINQGNVSFFSEMILNNEQSFVYGPDYNNVVEACKRTIESLTTTSVEFRNILKKQQVILFNAKIKCLKRIQDKYYFLFIISDITHNIETKYDVLINKYYPSFLSLYDEIFEISLKDDIAIVVKSNAFNVGRILKYTDFISFANKYVDNEYYGYFINCISKQEIYNHCSKSNPSYKFFTKLIINGKCLYVEFIINYLSDDEYLLFSLSLDDTLSNLKDNQMNRINEYRDVIDNSFNGIILFDFKKENPIIFINKSVHKIINFNSIENIEKHILDRINELNKKGLSNVEEKLFLYPIYKIRKVLDIKIKLLFNENNKNAFAIISENKESQISLYSKVNYENEIYYEYDYIKDQIDITIVESDFNTVTYRHENFKTWIKNSSYIKDKDIYKLMSIIETESVINNKGKFNLELTYNGPSTTYTAYYTRLVDNFKTIKIYGKLKKLINKDIFDSLSEFLMDNTVFVGQYSLLDETLSVLFLNQKVKEDYFNPSDYFNIDKAKNLMSKNAFELLKNTYTIKNIKNKKVTGTKNYTIKIKQRNNEWRTIKLKVSISPQDNNYKLMIVLQDITNEYNEQMILRQKAEVDYVSGLYNRSTFEDFFEQNLLNLDQSAFIIIDIDNFKNINDSHGHIVGDEVIKKLSKILKIVLGKNSFLSRFGGDEFVALLKGYSSIDELRLLLEQINIKCQSRITNLSTIKFNVSVGVCLLNNDISFMEAYQKSDFALYEAKSQGKGCIVIYE